MLKCELCWVLYSIVFLYYGVASSISFAKVWPCKDCQNVAEASGPSPWTSECVCKMKIRCELKTEPAVLTLTITKRLHVQSADRCKVRCGSSCTHTGRIWLDGMRTDGNLWPQFASWRSVGLQDGHSPMDLAKARVRFMNGSWCSCH